MLSQLHEQLLLLFRNRPELAPTLLRDALGITLPAYSEARIESADFTEVVPTEYRADLVVLLVDDVPVLGIIVEIQLSRDPKKLYSWPHYAASLRARLKCGCCVLVVATEPGVARWAAKPISLGPGWTFKPLALGPNAVPVVDDSKLAERYPELAVLSVMAHGHEDVATAVNLATVAAAAAQAAGLDSDTYTLYYDMIEAALGEAARKAFAMIPETYQFQGPTYLRGKAEGEAKGKAEGEAKGKAEGEARALLEMLEAREFSVTEEQRQRICGCTDSELLLVWIRRAVTVASVDELF